MPFTSETLHGYLGYAQPLFGKSFTETVSDALGQHTVLRYDPAEATGRWAPSELPAGQALNQPAPLFKKLEDKVAEEERARLGNKFP